MSILQFHPAVGMKFMATATSIGLTDAEGIRLGDKSIPITHVDLMRARGAMEMHMMKLLDYECEGEA